MGEQIWMPGSKEPRKPPRDSKVFVYFENANRLLIIPPVVEGPTPKGFQRYETSSAVEIERISKRMAAQKDAMFQALDERTARRLEEKMKQVRSNLHTIMAQTSSQYEKDFIRIMLKRMEDDEHKLRSRQMEMRLACEATEAPLK